jgi:hypothetical protein
MAASSGTQPNPPQGLRKWIKDHERGLAIAGALIVLATYVAKDIFQSRLEDKMRSIDLFFVESRLSNQLEMLYPDLRTELSRGSDAKKRYTDQDAAIMLNRWKDGGYFLPFYFLADTIECKDDQACRAAEWFRYEQALKSGIDANERFALIVGEPPSDQFKTEMERVEHLADAAFDKIENGPAIPMRDDVDDYSGPVSLLGPALNARRTALLLHGSEVIAIKRRELEAITIASGFLYFTGWCLTFLGRVYGISTVTPME